MRCRFAAKSPLMMMAQVVKAVRLTRSYTEGHPSSAREGGVYKDVVAEEMAAGPRTETTAHRTNSSNGGINTNGNSHGGSSAGIVQGESGRSRGNQPSGRGRAWGQDTGQSHKGRCRYCHNSTEHGWRNCPLRLSHEAEDAKEQANVVQDPAPCFTRVQADSSELQDFAIVIRDDMHVQKDVPASTEIVAYTNVFQVGKVNQQVVGDATVYIESAASSHMVYTESRISKQVI